jgi:hypothetical protein
MTISLRLRFIPMALSWPACKLWKLKKFRILKNIKL